MNARRPPLRRIALFAGVFLTTLLTILPLRAALEWVDIAGYGFSAREARGSLWRGTLRDARLGPAVAGDLSVRTGALPLLIGEARFQLVRRDGAIPFGTGLILSRHAVAIEQADGSIEADLPATAAAVTFHLSNLSARFVGGRCVAAAGRARAELTAGMVGPSISGDARCDDGSLQLSLADEGGAASLILRLAPDRPANVAVQVRPTGGGP